MVSIIVPVFNAEKYLSECIESIITQTLKNIEIVLVDDGSTDKSGEICDEYAKKDSRIRVLHCYNQGVVAARKEGLRAASGEYIAFADADDYLDKTMIEKLFLAIEQYDVDISMCGRIDFTGDNKKEVHHGFSAGKYEKEDLIKKIYPNMIVNKGFFDWGLFPGLWDKLFKRELLEKFFYKVDDIITMGDDAASTYPCLLLAESIYIIDECLYYYRQTPMSLVKKKSDTETEQKRYRVLYNSILQIFEEHKGIYDLRSQWLDYVLFLMIPRADVLLPEIENLEYLFPFPEVKRGSDIIIYGMGTYGQHLYRFIKQSGVCNIVYAVDRNYIELKKQGIDVDSPDSIRDLKCDAIVIANTYYKSRNSIYNDIKEKFPEIPIYMIDEETVKKVTNLSLLFD